MLLQNPYWYKAITSEPCYWKGNIFLNNKDPFWGKLGPAEVQQFKSNPFWMQYTQVPLRHIGAEQSLSCATHSAPVQHVDA